MNFNNEKIVHQMSINVETEVVTLEEIITNSTLEDNIESRPKAPFRKPLNLHHKSMYNDETVRNEINANKKKESNEQENNNATLRFTRSENQRPISEIEDIQIRSKCEVEADNFQRGRSVSMLTNSKFIGHCSEGDIHVHLRNAEKIQVHKMYDDTIEHGENSCTKVFMQLMCPSCCKGLFSENKGSVYMKRKSTVKSETKSTTMTICTDMDDGAKSVVSVEASETGAVGFNRTHSPIPEESEEKEKSTNKELESVEFTASKNEDKPKPLRNSTIDEDSNVNDCDGVLHKHRRMSLSETISNNIHEELSQNLQHDDDTSDAKWYNNKLRKTSFPNNNGNGHLQNDQKIGLKIGGKQYIEIEKQQNEDEPPFNFQAVLRKTNTTRQSLRRSSQVSENQSIEQNDFVAELLPGIILRGTASDL